MESYSKIIPFAALQYIFSYKIGGPQLCKSESINLLCCMMLFIIQNNLKNLDVSRKMDLDSFGCVRRKKEI